jgi:hypothetical protein
VAKTYGEIGLVVNPEKTWITCGPTEYLHEVYQDGQIWAFPARIFRAVAWRKPLTNLAEQEFGEARANSLISVFRMAMRRGLNIQNMLRNYLKTLVPEWREEKFQSWLLTPYIFGGFGGGVSGRVSLGVKTKERRRLRIDVGGLKGMPEFWRNAAGMRAKGMVPLPGVRNTWKFERVKGTRRMDPFAADRYAHAPEPRVDWILADVCDYQDAYERKLKLEWKLATGDKIQQSDLPKKFKEGDIDHIYRTYRHLVSRTIGIETGVSGPETFHRMSKWANKVWSGVCYWMEGKTRALGERKTLCELMHHLVHVKAYEQSMVSVAV